MKVGIVVMDENPADARTVVRAADQTGLHSLWTIDYGHRSSLTRTAAFAAVCEPMADERAGARQLDGPHRGRRRMDVLTVLRRPRP